MEPEESAPPAETPEAQECAPVEENAPAPSGFPFSFSSVASFAATGWGRLLLWQAVLAIALGGSVMLVLGQYWAPVLDAAVAQLPEQAGLSEGQLNWPADQTGVLAENGYLRIIIDPTSQQQHGQLADLQLEFRRNTWVLSSVLGYLDFPYAVEEFRINRETHIPWWGSRRPFLLLGASVAVGVGYSLLTLLFGLLGMWPAKTVAFFADREGGLSKLWRLTTAAWLPAGALLTMGCLCYALQFLPLMGLLILILLHLIVGWVFLFFAPFFLPPAVHTAENPFDHEDAPEEDPEAEESDEPSQGRPDNPFA
ncbi:MAG: hypothetical protein MKZ76_00835 [Pedosphaera sp.]|jgi:hypothetical protein|nr:hypothetical protein [Pedosphaera sp.]